MFLLNVLLHLRCAFNLQLSPATTARSVALRHDAVPSERHIYKWERRVPTVSTVDSAFALKRVTPKHVETMGRLQHTTLHICLEAGHWGIHEALQRFITKHGSVAEAEATCE